MATIDYTITHDEENGVIVVEWVGFVAGDEGRPVVGFFDYPYRVVTVHGTFVSSLLNIQGSLDGTNYATVKDIENAAISYIPVTDNASRNIRDLVLYLRPRCFAGAGGTSINTTLVMRKREE